MLGPAAAKFSDDPAIACKKLAHTSGCGPFAVIAASVVSHVAVIVVVLDSEHSMSFVLALSRLASGGNLSTIPPVDVSHVTLSFLATIPSVDVSLLSFVHFASTLKRHTH